MMIGLGVYLPFYMSLTAFLGSCVKLAYDKWAAHRDAAAGLSDEERAAKDAAFQEQGLVVAGLRRGEAQLRDQRRGEGLVVTEGEVRGREIESGRAAAQRDGGVRDGRIG